MRRVSFALLSLATRSMGLTGHGRCKEMVNWLVVCGWETLSSISRGAARIGEMFN